MSARVSKVMGQKYNKDNYLLMHALGRNPAGVMGTGAGGGMFIAMFSRTAPVAGVVRLFLPGPSRATSRY